MRRRERADGVERGTAGEGAAAAVANELGEVGAPPNKARQAPPKGEPAPEVLGIASWINPGPHTIAGLTEQGRVVLVDFWTYTCVNCINSLPHVTEWDRRYGNRGLTVLGIHSPEFAFEKSREGVVDAVERHRIDYPVAQDNDFVTWFAFKNRYWPAKYLIRSDGHIPVHALRRRGLSGDRADDQGPARRGRMER